MSNLYDNIRKSREKKGGPRTKKDSTIDPAVKPRDNRQKNRSGPAKN